MSVALPACPSTPTAVSATLLTARMTPAVFGGLVADLTALARELSRTASL